MGWITVTTFLPLVGVPVLLFGTRMRDDVARAITLVVTVAAFIVSLGMLGRFDGGQAGFQLVEQATWVRSLGMQYLVGIDGVGLLMVLLTTFLFPLSVLASWKLDHNVRLFMASMLVLETGVSSETSNEGDRVPS